MNCNFCDDEIEKTDNRIELHKGYSWVYYFCSDKCFREWMAAEPGLSIQFQREEK